MQKIYNKLVRDRILEICQSRGAVTKYRRLNQKEFKKALIKKLIEEAKELEKAKNLLDLIDEIADVHEVLLNIAKANKLKWSEIEKQRKVKNIKRGGFGKRHFLISISE